MAVTTDAADASDQPRAGARGPATANGLGALRGELMALALKHGVTLPTDVDEAVRRAAVARDLLPAWAALRRELVHRHRAGLEPPPAVAGLLREAVGSQAELATPARWIARAHAAAERALQGFVAQLAANGPLPAALVERVLAKEMWRIAADGDPGAHAVDVVAGLWKQALDRLLAELAGLGREVPFAFELTVPVDRPPAPEWVAWLADASRAFDQLGISKLTAASNVALAKEPVAYWVLVLIAVGSLFVAFGAGFALFIPWTLVTNKKYVRKGLLEEEIPPWLADVRAFYLRPAAGQPGLAERRLREVEAAFVAQLRQALAHALDARLAAVRERRAALAPEIEAWITRERELRSAVLDCAALGRALRRASGQS